MPKASSPSLQHLCLAFPPRKHDVHVHTTAPHDITVLDIHTLSSLSTKRNEGNCHISLYKHLILIVLLNIKINNLNSATSRQATQVVVVVVVVVVVDNAIYQQKLECPNGYNVSNHCVNMLVIDIIENSFIVCGFI